MSTEQQPVRITIDWWGMRMPYEEKVQLLRTHPAELIKVIVNHHYNTFCRSRCGRKHSKSVPCITGDWHDIDFEGHDFGTYPYNTQIPIGRKEVKGSGPLIGFMVNNRYGLPQRMLIEDERSQVVAYLDEAMSPCSLGHEDAALTKLWDYMQTLAID